MSDNFFDIKNDRRLSVYLYRFGFVLWLTYILLGASFFQQYAVYRPSCAVMCAFSMLMGLSASMYYDYYHHPAEFEQKKKWLIISYMVVGAMVYFFILKDKALTIKLF
ncbi:MAG: hypothetical protein ACK4GN_16765 [Runella sp.]